VAGRGNGDCFLHQLEARLFGVADGDLPVAPGLPGQRQELLHQGAFPLQQQRGHKQRCDDGQIGQAGAVFQAGNLLAAVANGAAQFVLCQAGAFAQETQRRAKRGGEGEGLGHIRW
jgi:hypothetical protein